MITPIPIGASFVSNVNGAVLRLVPCEGCGAEYVYQMERFATGTGTSLLYLDNKGAQTRADAQADAQLRDKLKRGVDVVPCPQCGWIQQHMFRRARREHRRWMVKLGAVLMLLSFPLAGLALGVLAVLGREAGDVTVPAVLLLGGVGAFFVAGVGLLVAKFVSARRYDPNTEDEALRIRLGRRRAMLREELEKHPGEALSSLLPR